MECGKVYESAVAPREGRVSRNLKDFIVIAVSTVAPREGRVSRNCEQVFCNLYIF